jgi:hypothetical protein
MSTTKKPYQIIGLCGNQGTGKDYMGRYLADTLPETSLILAFADHIKINAIVFHDADAEKVYGQKDFETRRLLQRLGTEEGRDKYGEDVWVRAVESWMDLYYSRGVKRFILTDVRFPNEAEWIKRCGGLLIKLEAPDRFQEQTTQEGGGDEDKYKEIVSHRSEQSIGSIEGIDIVINNRKSNQENVKAELIREVEKHIRAPGAIENTEPEKEMVNQIVGEMDDTPLGYWGFYG